MRALELHASAKIIQRSKGRSSVAAAAYRSGEKLYDQRTGLTHDYTKKNGVEFSRIYLPDNASENLRKREALWNAVEAKENRSNSCTARELEVAFPSEFNAMQRREAGDSISCELMKRYGCAVDIALHAPNKNGDERNFHAHILFTDRAFDPSTKDGWAKKKYRDLSNDKITIDGEKTTRGQKEVLSLRAFTAGVMNNIAKRDDLSVTVEHLSFETRGIDREPQIHLGTVANDMERNGKSTERGDENKKIIDLNKQRRIIQSDVSEQNFDKFDEFAGAKRAEFQSWSSGEKIDEERRCDREKYALEVKIEDFYGKSDMRHKTAIKVLRKRMEEKGLKRLARKVNGADRDDRDKLERHKKSLTNSEMRKEGQRTMLKNKQNTRYEEMQKLHGKIEKDLEETIEKARSSYREDETDGKSEDTGRAHAKKAKRKQIAKPREIAKKASRKSNRTTSYAGKNMMNHDNSRLKSKYKDSIKSEKSNKETADRASSDHDFPRPDNPSLGR